ncbi:undecaprenyl/decaprenyl-phosphate alpha-N-acetylglucosaminyl 1-phosphate transferase, partial [Candidatus Pelagibacter sp.]|nr:undecaprenyl/decaprenyl-phosphate alpha-N-acetylglucosaminyl 1-phosphate transferase [Candidatus Pelagibacter sp.]
TFFFSKASYILNLVDIPNKRKKHSKPTAYTGGLAISLSYICSLQIFETYIYSLNIIVSIALLIAVVGFLDDKHNLNIGGKLSLQIVPILYLIIIDNLNLTHIGDYNYFKLELNSFSVPFTLLCVMFLINAFNYFDGLDGVLSFTSISVLGILYFLITDENIKLFLIIILLPICFFLLFNFSIFNLPKLFLGDNGSLLLGFIIAFILIYLANQRIVHPILLAWSVSIFVYEFISINLIRLKNKKNPFKAGQDHLHHIFFKKTKSIFLTNFLIVSTNIVLFTSGYISFEIFNPLISLILFISLFIIFFIIRNTYLIKK